MSTTFYSHSLVFISVFIFFLADHLILYPLTNSLNFQRPKPLYRDAKLFSLVIYYLCNLTLEVCSLNHSHGTINRCPTIWFFLSEKCTKKKKTKTLRVLRRKKHIFDKFILKTSKTKFIVLETGDIYIWLMFFTFRFLF